jgi:hypothetical protein
MKSNRYRIYLGIFTIVMILLALAAESVYFSDFEYRLRTKKFNKILSEKETIIENCLNSLKLILGKGEALSQEAKENLFSVIEKQGTILDYVDNKLFYWSDNSFDVNESYDDSLFSKPLVFIQNGWFLTETVKTGNERIIALLRIRSEYGFENDLVRNGFVKDFGVPEKTGFSLDKKKSEFQILTKEGTWLFSLVFPEGRKGSFFIAVPLLIWTIAFILFLLLIIELAAFMSSKGWSVLAVLMSISVFFIIYFLLLISGKPAVLQETELFSPYRFTLNSFLPSLGHLFLMSILISVFTSKGFYRTKAFDGIS